MDSPSHSDYAPQKRKRPSSRSSDSSHEPPSTRRRSRSPSSVPSPGPSVTPKKSTVPTVESKNYDSKTHQQDQEKEKEKEGTLRADFAKLLNTRSGGVYIPPARLRAMQEEVSGDKTNPEYQRISWDALRKSVTGIVNRVNVANIKTIIPELFSENLIRGRGLFARSVMKAQAASLPFTPVFAALVAIINTKLPQVGELVVTRLVSQFRRAFKRNDKTVCHSTTTFIAHLVNQAVANEMIVLQILVLLLERPTDDSIEIAVGLTREVGAFLNENSPKSNNIVFGRFRDVLNEGRISHRVQYMIEVLMQVRKDKYKDNPIIPEGLDLVEEEEQITHHIQLEEELQVQEGLNIFKFDPNYIENEDKYNSIKAEILGEDSDEESGSSESEESDDEVAEEKEGIEDRTETNLVNLRRVIYLTIMNALNYEEAVHKLLKVQLQEGEEIELIKMVIECCSQERSYSTFYGLVGERFCKLNRVWTDCCEQAFSIYYTTIHRYETNRLRNIARFFGSLFASDAISWMVMECIKINEDDTTSSSRIFIKIMMQEMMESMGLKTLADRFKDPEIKHGTAGMFPMDIPKNTRFSINYFTSIGLGVLTEEMREYLQNAPRLILEQRRAMLEAESSSSDSDSSDSDSDSSDDDSSGASSTDDIRRRRSSRSPSRSRSRSRNRRRSSFRSISRSRTPPRRPAADSTRRPEGVGRSRPPPMNRRGDRSDVSHSRSPPRHRERERSPVPPMRSRRERGRDGDKDIDVDNRRRDSRRPRSLSPPRHVDDRNGRGTYDHDRKRRPSPTRERDEPPSSHPNKYEPRVARDHSPRPHMRSSRVHEGGRRYEEKERSSGRQRSPPRHGKEKRDDVGRDHGYRR